MRTEIMAVLPSVPAGLCAFLSLLACCPALVKAWKRPSPEVLALGVVRVLLFFFLSAGGWGKIKPKLTTLPRIFIHVVCRFNSIAIAIQR